MASQASTATPIVTPEKRERARRWLPEAEHPLIPDRSMPFAAPAFVHPCGRWTPAESLEQLSGNTRQLVEWLEATDLRENAVPSPPLKAVSRGKHELADAYQWLLAAAGHTQRHTRQILEVRASAGFPAR